jgi:glycosyltransferase involved in cell wall biosynthesis
MKFCYIANEALDRTSAQAIHIDEICEALARLNHEVTLYAPQPEGFHNSKSYASVFLKVPESAASVFFQMRLFFRLWRDMRNGKPDVIYCRHALLLFMPALIGKLFNVPVVLEVNGPLLEEAKRIDHSLVGKTLRSLKVIQFFESFSVRNASSFVVVASGIEDYLVDNYAVDPRKVHVVANGVDTESFKPLGQEIVRGKLGLDQRTVYVGYIGSLYPWQGLRYIIEAAALVLAERKDVKFLVLGTGDELPALAALVEKSKLTGSVTILPPVPHERVPEYINALDICLCYPTRFRANATSPLKVYEYLACRKAVVLADIQGMRETFGDIVDYAEPESSSALAKRLIRLIDDEKCRERLAVDGFAFIRRERTWEKVAGRIVAIAEGNLQRGQTAPKQSSVSSSRIKVLVAAIGPLVGTGYAARIESMVRAYVAEGWQVDLLHMRLPSEPKPEDGMLALLGAYIEVPLSPVRPVDHLVMLPPLAALTKRAAVRGLHDYDLAQAESSAAWPAVARVRARVKVITMHDDDAVRYRRIASSIHDPRRKAIRSITALKYGRFQRRAMAEADGVWFVSETEMRRLSSQTRRGALLVPNGAAAGFFDVPPGWASASPIVTFVGPSTYDTNLRAARAFLQHVWPKVTSRVSSAEFRLVGLGWEAFRGTPGVVDRGWVDDLPHELHEAQVVVAPLLDGGGTKIKVLEAMAAARPVVATSIAAESIPSSSGLSVTDSWTSFADHVAGFLGDPDRRLEAGQANREAVATFAWPAVWAHAIREVNALLGHPTRVDSAEAV